jgi:small ligand-binding sensory domain FIST
VPQPEGRWTFKVTATDDRSVTTTAERTFSLDKTLGSLTVSPNSSHGRTVHFLLSRKADIVVAVERRNGIALTTFHLPHLTAGAHSFVWRRQIGGARAPKGRYLMRVDATSAIGTSSLVAAFSLK